MRTVEEDWLALLAPLSRRRDHRRRSADLRSPSLVLLLLDGLLLTLLNLLRRLLLLHGRWSVLLHHGRRRALRISLTCATRDGTRRARDDARRPSDAQLLLRGDLRLVVRRGGRGLGSRVRVTEGLMRLRFLSAVRVGRGSRSTLVGRLKGHESGRRVGVVVD